MNHFLIKKLLLINTSIIGLTSPVSTLVITISNAEINAPEIVRKAQVYKISEILNYKISDTQTPWYMEVLQNSLLKNLHLNDKDWKENTKINIQSLKTNLQKLEKEVYEPASQKNQDEFECIVKQGGPFSNIEEIDDLINQNIPFIGGKFTYTALQFPGVSGVSDYFKIATEFNANVVKLYNFLITTKIIDKEHIGKLFFNISHQNPDPAEYDPETTFGAIIPTNDGDLKTQIGFFLNPQNWADRQKIQKGYKNGFISASHFTNTFVHEFGHIVDYYYRLNNPQRDQLNQSFQVGINDALSVILNQIPDQTSDETWNRADDNIYYTIDHIVESAWGKKIEDEVLLNFTKFTAIPSHYARQLNDVEWWAEGFAYWYLTPQTLRTVAWDWWHEFFTKKLPTRK